MGQRILHAISSANPAGGGPIEGIHRLAAIHATLGHDSQIVCLDAPESPWLGASPCPVHALGPAWSHFAYSPRLVPWLRERRDQFDAVVVHGLWQFPGVAVRRALLNSATPYWVFTHGMLDPWFKRQFPLKHAKKWLFWPWADYRTLRDARAVLFTCEEERRLARDSFWLYRCTEQVVGFGTQEPPDAIERQRLAFLERFPKLRGRRLLLFLGRMHPKKGPDLVLEAFAALLRKAEHEPNQLPHLVMAGPDDSTYCLDLKSRVLSLGIVAHTTWTGLLEGDAKWGALRTADAFVLPSHQENFGIAVAEALACGVPVLISRQVNIWREVIAHQAGFVDDDDLPGTQRQLERWIAMDGDERAAFATRARNCFKQEFDLVRTARALNEMIAAASEGRADGARRAQTATADAVSSAR